MSYLLGWRTIAKANITVGATTFTPLTPNGLAIPWDMSRSYKFTINIYSAGSPLYPQAKLQIGGADWGGVWMMHGTNATPSVVQATRSGSVGSGLVFASVTPSDFGVMRGILEGGGQDSLFAVWNSEFISGDNDLDDKIRQTQGGFDCAPGTDPDSQNFSIVFNEAGNEGIIVVQEL